MTQNEQIKRALAAIHASLEEVKSAVGATDTFVTFNGIGSKAGSRFYGDTLASTHPDIANVIIDSYDGTPRIVAVTAAGSATASVLNIQPEGGTTNFGGLVRVKNQLYANGQIGLYDGTGTTHKWSMVTDAIDNMFSIANEGVGYSLNISKLTSNVMVGTTVDYGYKLYVNGTARVASDFSALGEISSYRQSAINSSYSALHIDTYMGAAFGGSLALGDGVNNDLLAFNPPDIQEIYNSSTGTWSTTAVTSNLFKGNVGQNFGLLSLRAADNISKVRFTWSSFGYRFWKSLILSGASNGNPLKITLETSADGVTWINNTESDWFTTWPGYHVINHIGTSSGMTQMRILVEVNHTMQTEVNIGQIAISGSYGGKKALFEWDYARNTFWPGQQHKFNNGRIYLRADCIEDYTSPSDEGGVNFNYVGYEEGNSYYRDFTVYDGKTTLMMKLDGSAKTARFTSDEFKVRAGQNNAEHTVKYVSQLGSCNDGTYRAYLLLAPAYVDGLVSESTISGAFFLNRGSTGEGNRQEMWNVVSKRAYGSDHLHVDVMGTGDQKFFEKTCKVTYNGVVYHAVETSLGGGQPTNGVYFVGSTNLTPLYVGEDLITGTATAYGTSEIRYNGLLYSDITFYSEYNKIFWSDASSSGFTGGIVADDGSYKGVSIFHGNRFRIATDVNDNPAYAKTRLEVTRAGSILINQSAENGIDKLLTAGSLWFGADNSDSGARLKTGIVTVGLSAATTITSVVGDSQAALIMVNGDNGYEGFIDLLFVGFNGQPIVLSSQTVYGSVTITRTYSKAGGNINLVLECESGRSFHVRTTAIVRL